jgi:shikimate dehydrogenase
MITGNTQLIAHIGYPTGSFKAPMIYNPFFASRGVDAVVVPMGIKAEDFSTLLRPLFRMSNIHGALITMPHKITCVPLLDEVSTAVKIAGSCNAILKRPDGSLYGDMFDGEGFVRGVLRKGIAIKGARALVVGAGGVGSAIAASLASAGLGELMLHDVNPATAEGLAGRLAAHNPALIIRTGSNNPAGYDLVINATPMGMNEGDPMPLDITRLSPASFVGEVVMKAEMTGFLKAAKARGCTIQVGVDMLFEMIPAYLEFFGYPTATPDELRSLSAITY